MEMLLSVWEFFQNNILTKPAFFIGFIVLAGYALLGKKWYECLAGFIKGTIVFNSPILIISGFVPLFFDNATFAVFANRLGGIRAAAIIPFCSGIIQVLGGGFAAYHFTTGNFGGWHGNFDWDAVWPFIGVIMENLQYVGVAAVVILLLAIPQILYQRNKDTYFVIAEDFDKYKEILAKKQGVPVEEVVID
ncbi:PTS transporter subunit IIC [Selenomonas sp. ND2010]|uniref:PTS transporter subunit IIC n=1 Tax=Selenomonas sp. ND2010 TaxID=1410618 RepID=UPI000AA2E411|nr:PTS transporter subunit IIC [Selenomonas sp. ND2010]